MSTPDDLEGAARRLVEFALTSLLTPTLLVDGGGFVEAVSPAALADLDAAPDALVGRPLREVIGVGHEELAEVEETPAATRFARVRASALRWRASSLATARADGGWLVEFHLEDVPDDQIRLDARAERLDDLLDDLTQRLDLLNRYVGLISHDLQAPARRLLSFVELLRGDITEAPEAVDGELDAIERGARHMLRLTSELLQYSRLGRQPMQLDPVDAQEVLDDTLEQLGDTLTRSGADVRVDRPLPSVVASATLLGVVFKHLLDNAIAYRGDDPPRVAITWDADGSSDDGHSRVRIHVADNGIGIAPELRSAVFEPFRRLVAGDDTHSGLGLATVHDIVGRFGGSIVVSESTPRKGTTFTITLLAPRDADHPPE